jgi:hypothetical protein
MQDAFLAGATAAVGGAACGRMADLSDGCGFCRRVHGRPLPRLGALQAGAYETTAAVGGAAGGRMGDHCGGWGRCRRAHLAGVVGPGRG